MADYIFTITEGVKAGIVSITAHANKVAGNTLGTTDYARIPNDGKVVLLMDSVTGDTLTFSAVPCSHGRTETLTPIAAAGKFVCFGPFSPDEWNQSDGCVIFKLTAGNANDIFLALRTGNPT